MGLNAVVSSERLHIAFFGMRNAGKSSLVNAVTGQNLAVVSDIKGTTTDPVKKAMELLPLGPVVIIDTPGMDDVGQLGDLRVKRAREILAQTDIAVLTVDAQKGLDALDKELLELFEHKKLPYLVAYNKADLCVDRKHLQPQELYVSAKTKENITKLKQRIAALAEKEKNEQRIVGDLLSPGDFVVLVTPIDEAAPKGRLILPQQQTIRDILDAHCSIAVCQDTELKQTLDSLSVKPKLIITDSQVFEKVAHDAPKDVALTSFSILFARYKGDLETLVKGAAQLKQLKSGDRILISEGCSHHRQCNDIGTVKLPGWIENYSGASLQFEFASGGEFPECLTKYALIVHCGGCMLNEKEMKSRIAKAEQENVAIVNYGLAIALMHGILRRSLQPFPDLLAKLDKTN